MGRDFLAAALIAAAAPAQAMTVATFLQKAEALKAKGPMALFSGDLKLLKSEAVSAAGQLRAERLAAEKAGRKPAYCPKSGGSSLNSDQLLAIMKAVSPADRNRVAVKDALRAHFARTAPCT